MKMTFLRFSFSYSNNNNTKLDAPNIIIHAHDEVMRKQYLILTFETSLHNAFCFTYFTK